MKSHYLFKTRLNNKEFIGLPPYPLRFLEPYDVRECKELNKVSYWCSVLIENVWYHGNIVNRFKKNKKEGLRKYK